MAEENAIIVFSPLHGEKQTISIPFLWEEKPGTPKKEWILTKPTPWIVPPPSPTKLIVSVPFLWEEKPGKPLPQLSNPPSSFLHEIEYQRFNESLSDVCSSYFEDWHSLSETDGHGSSSGSVTRNTSIDALAMERLYPLPLPPADAGLGSLFPLSPPSAGFLDKVCGQDRAIPAAYQEVASNICWREDCGIMAKRTLTLGELMLLSRKLSYRMKPVVMKKKGFSTVKSISADVTLVRLSHWSVRHVFMNCTYRLAAKLVYGLESQTANDQKLDLKH